MVALSNDCQSEALRPLDVDGCLCSAVASRVRPLPMSLPVPFPRSPPTGEDGVAFNALLADLCPAVDAADIRRGEQLGVGTWSTVFAGDWRGTPVAIKAFHARSSSLDSSSLWRMAIQEASALQCVRSPRIVHLLGACSVGSPVLVMELAVGGTLHFLLHGQRGPPLRPHDRVRLAVQVAEAVASLHALSWVHRDVKSRNVLLDASGDAKLADFGLAERMPASSSVRGGGSTAYLAPECLCTPPQPPAPPADVWALGCVLAEIFGGSPPHSECEDTTEVVAKILVRGEAPSVPPHADLAAGDPESGDVRSLLTGCLAFPAGDRAAAATILQALRSIQESRGPLGS